MASWSAREYARRKSLGLCVECAGAMLPEWSPGVRCPECAERAIARHARYRATAKGKATAQAMHARTRDKYRAGDRERAKRERLARKLAGLCLWCKAPSLEDSGYCQKHLDYHRAKDRARAAKKRAEARKS